MNEFGVMHLHKKAIKYIYLKIYTVYTVYTTTGQKLMYPKHLNGSLSQIQQK